jgi:hypothetical protein
MKTTSVRRWRYSDGRSAIALPATPRGFYDATNDTDALRELWRCWPAPLISTPTGSVNTSDVLDIDPRHGAAAWHAANRHRLPPTRIHETRSGGLHILFCHHEGVRNSAGKIAPGIDVRGQGGFVIWWPAAGCSVCELHTPASWPDWLLPLILPPPAPPPPPRRPASAMAGTLDPCIVAAMTTTLTGWKWLTLGRSMTAFALPQSPSAD